MAKQLNVNLAFNADTSQAKAQIQSLSKALQEVTKLPGQANSLFDDTDIRKASQAALELQSHLAKATNVDTGKLDLSRFSSSLKASNKDLNTYCATLLSVGERGQQAFLQLAQAIATADTPVTRVNKKLAEMGTTLKNTARWQLSSSILHGFMGAVQSAYGYAQDLNESLNNIRIVTGQNIEQMEKFAEKANKAAKALSTTTTDYTNASLIYYQQGLNDEQVAERTAVTIKMANAAGVSAQTVSDQLTAVWNNFYDGSQSLEYYADVMTALGAATASSTDEISEGLNKFAAVAETVGLSYEYATSALATVTATTRESADVVGTAFKTLFARIQGLTLGETLEDGTDLNKYSEALNKVGIKIKDTNGEMKDMDTILNELGAKWQTLSKDQQTALAQTVAGVRQYTQLVALMDNWDYFQQNLGVAQGSTGTLQEQADIYAESWEAAQERVAAAAENIYQSLLDDDFFISILNGFEKILESVGGLAEGLGGLKGVLSVVGSIFLTNFAKEMPSTLENLKQNFMVFTGQSEKLMRETQQNLSTVLQDQIANNPDLSESYKTELEGVSLVNKMKSELVRVSSQLSQAERTEYEAKIQNVTAIYKELAALKEKQRAAEDAAKTAQKNLGTSGADKAAQVFSNYQKAENRAASSFERINNLNQQKEDLNQKAPGTETQEDLDALDSLPAQQAAATNAFVQARQEADALEQEISELGAAYRLSGEDISQMMDEMASAGQLSPESLAKLKGEAEKVAQTYKSIITQQAQMSNTATSIRSQTAEWKKLAETIKTNPKNLEANQKAITHTQKAMSSYLNKLEQLAKEKGISGSIPKIKALQKSIEDLNPDNIEQITQEFDEMGKELSGELDQKVKQLDKPLGAIEQRMADMKFSPEAKAEMTKTAEAAAAMGVQVSNVSENISGLGDETPKATFKMSTALTEFGASVMSVSATVDSIKNAISIFTDDSSTGFEKIGAAISVVTAAMSAYSSITALATTITKANTAGESSNAIAKLASGAASKLAALFGITLTTSKTAETGAVAANTAAWYANPIMWIALVIVGVIAALAGLIAIIGAVSNALVDAYNADAIAAENAETAAKNLATAYDEVKTEYEEMISAMENYQTARDGLDSLTKGTEEYREALKEANRQALELINQYGLIEGQDYSWEGDELVIKDNALNRVRSEKESEVDQAYAASQMASAKAKEMRNIADQTELRRQMRDDAGVGNGDQFWKGAADLAAGVALDVLSGGLSGGMGTFAAVASISNRAAKSDNYDAAIDKAIEEAKTNANLFDNKKAMAEALDIDLNDTELIDALWENQNSIQQLSADMNAADQAWKLAAQNSANEIMSESGYANTEAGRMALEAGGEVYDQLYSDAYNQYLKDASSRGLFYTGNAASKAAFAKYAEEAKLDQLNGFEVTNYKGDGTVEYKYYDEEGQEQIRTATAEEIAATLAAADAAGQLEGALSQLRGTISDLNASVDLGDHALAEFLSTGNLEGATYAEYQDLKNDVTDENGNIDNAKVNEALGLTGDAAADLELAKSRGYESAEAYREAFINSLDVEWEIPSGLSDNIANQLSLGAANKIQNTYEELGTEGGEAFLGALNTVAENADWSNLTPEDQTALLNELANIDWTSWDAGDRAIEIAEKYGVAIDGTSEAWKRNVTTMRDAANAVPDLDKLRETMAKVKEISDELELGSILNEEDYKLLVNYNKELENYFTILSDGSAQFTGDLLDYQQSIKEANRQNLEETMRIYQDRILEQQALYQSGLNMIGGDINNLDQYRDSELYTAENGNQYYSGANVDTQLKFLESQNYNSDQIASWRQDMEDGFMSVENLDAIGQAVNNVGTEFANLGSAIASDQALVQGLMNEIALGAEDAEERQQLFDEGLINEDALNAAAMAAHNEEKWEGMDSEDVEDYADHLQDAAESSALLSDELKNNEEAAEDVALYTKKMNKGIEALSKGFEEWGDVLTRSDKSSEEFATAMKEIKTAMSDVLGVSEDFLSDDFILQNMEDIKLAAEGDAEAIDRLAIAAAQDILIHIDFEDEAAKAKAMALHGELAGLIPDIQVGATLTGEDEFLQKAQEIVAAAGMTAEQANAYFRAMGFETKFAVEPQPVEQRVPITYTKSSIVEAGIDWETGAPYWTTATSSWQDGYDTYTGTMDAIAMSTDGKTPKIESLTRTNSGAMNNSSGANAGGNTSGGGGGGGNKNKKPEKVDLGERYKEITDSIEDMEDAIDDASKAADRLYGKGRLDQMKAANNLLMEEIGLLKQKKTQAENYLIEDRQALDKAAKEANVTLDIDDSGRITNYTTTVEILEKRIKDLQNAAMANDGSISESEQEGIDQLQEQADNLLSAIEQYDGTRETLEDVTNEINDQFYAWQDQNYEMLSYSLELKVDIQDDKLETVEYYLDALADDFYSVAEAAALMVGGTGAGNNQLDIFRDNLEMQAKHVEELSGALARNEISHAAYVEGVQNSREAIYDNLTSLRELDKAMMEYYGETLDMASEKIDEYVSKIEFQSEKLEHFQNVMAKLGKETDYKAMGTILKGAEAVSKNQVKAAKDVLDFYTGEAETYLAQYQDAIARGDKAAADMAYQYYADAMERATEAEKEYMASLENWADAARAVLDNKLASFASDFEKSLTGGSSFDQLLTSMERANTLQEEYLTTTNQIYETNKLMRIAQQQIDKSTNSIAKSKFQNFIKETEQLQNQGQLSQFELEIQQAKYDLLLAEIALQEAQDAKSVVRLQRDSEGNFGYVYTADQNQVSEAQQGYEDAQNKLYNIGLEGANEYAEKSIQAQAEFTETMSELQQAYLEGAFASEEEYNRAVEEAKASYYQQLQTYSNLYSVALTTDSRVVADAWSTDFANMITNTDQWSQAVDGYIFQVSGAFQEWGNTADQIANASGTNLDSLEHNVQDIVTESDNLVESLTGDGGLIEALSGELEKVREVTTAYGEQRQSVLDLIGTYEGLANSLNSAALAQTNYNSAAYENSPTYQAGTVGGSSSGGGGGSGNNSSGGNGSSGTGGSGSGWDNQGYTTGKVKEAQTYVGTNADGKWGPLSRSAAISKVGSDRIADVFTHMRQHSGGGGNSHLPDIGGRVNADVFAVAMDTGGYTGEWGPYGKMAMLHEKELVLNKEDTANLLLTMEMLDSIIAQLNLQTQYSQLGNLMSPSYQSTQEALEQNVHIEASFPGVSSSNEIEEALNNLINQASQYANRK